MRLKDRVLGNITSGKCEVTGMTATGIPPHIELHRQIEVLQVENKELRAQLKTQHTELMEQLPILVTEKVLESVRVEGVQQLSRSDMESLIANAISRFSAQFASPALPPAPPIVPAESGVQQGHPSYHWGGRMHRSVPEGWCFPRGNVKPVCDLFITGQLHSDHPIRPYRYIVLCTLPRSEQAYYSKAEYVFSTLCNVAISIGAVEAAVAFVDMPISRWDSVYKLSFEYLVTKVELQIEKPLRKAGDLSVNTFYNYLKALP